MSKELQALEDIILYLNANEPKGLYCKNIEIIKTTLKALEIIKEKKWLVEDILNAFIEDKEKCDLLKEILK